MNTSKYQFPFLSKRYNLQFTSAPSETSADVELDDSQESCEDAAEDITAAIDDNIVGSGEEEYVKTIQIELTLPLSMSQLSNSIEDIVLPLSPTTLTPASHTPSAVTPVKQESSDAQ